MESSFPQPSFSPEASFAVPELLRIQTSWRKPWLINVLSQHGRDHFLQGHPMQDAYRVGGNGPHTWLIVADGVSSQQPNSAVGAQLAVAACEEYLAAKVYEAPNRKVLLEAINHVRERLFAKAQSVGLPAFKFATTLAFVVLTGPRLAGANIGDSSILAYTQVDHLNRKKQLLPLCSTLQPAVLNPDKKGYVCDITNDQWERYVETSHKTLSPVHTLILATDGGNNFFMDEATTPAGSFETDFIDAFDEALKQLGPRLIGGYFADFIYKHEAQDDDDRTIIVASKIPSGQFPGLDASA